MKCTPQKTMYCASVSAAIFGELVAVAGEVGEADHFVALIVVAEDDRRVPSAPRVRDAVVHLWSGSAR